MAVSFRRCKPSLISRNMRSRLDFSRGKYPLNAKDWPFSPLAISASKMEEGPTWGLTDQPALCAIRTAWAPGSATPGAPASVMTPMSSDCRNQASKSTKSCASECSFSKNVGRTFGFKSGKASFSNLLAALSLSTMKREQDLNASRAPVER